MVPAGAAAAQPLDIGFSDSLYGSAERDLWLDRTAAVGADIIRVNMYWAVVGFSKPSDPRDPADPAYDWSEYDRQIVSAAEHGFAIELTVTNAPHWAEGPGRPPSGGRRRELAARRARPTATSSTPSPSVTRAPTSSPEVPPNR